MGPLSGGAGSKAVSEGGVCALRKEYPVAQEWPLGALR